MLLSRGAVQSVRGVACFSQAARRPNGSSWGAGNRQHARFFDKMMRDGSATFDAQDGDRFIAAMLEYEDDLDLLYRLTNPQEYGTKRLRSALASDSSPVFMRDRVVPLLAKLGSDQLGRGSCKQPLVQLIEVIYRVPGLLGCLHTALEGHLISDATAVGWFALMLTLNVEGSRSDPQLQLLVPTLKLRGGGTARAAAELEVVLAGAADANSNGNSSAAMGMSNRMVAIEDLHTAAGGRHDNDPTSYRDILIMPTSEEVLSTRAPYLPRDVDSDLLAATSPEAALLDHQFRLLREDMVGPLRKELSALGFGKAQQNAAERQKIGKAIASSRNVYGSVQILGVSMHHRPCIIVSVELPNNHKASQLKTSKKRENFWREFGRGTLPRDGLVCLAAPGKPLLFGTVVRRETVEMAEERPMVGIAFEAGPGLDWVLQTMGKPMPADTMLLQVSTNLMTTKPVLDCLKSMPSIPFPEEIVHGRPSQHLEYLTATDIEQEMAQLPASLDFSQLEAIRQALSQRVALIQGPPGTGKTFAGALLCQSIVRSSEETILCVCYTNHALDQFLESVLDKDITRIVRFGTRSKSARLEPYTIRELDKAAGSKFSPAERRRFWQVREELKDLDSDVSNLASNLFPLLNGKRNPWQMREQQRQEQQRQDFAQEFDQGMTYEEIRRFVEEKHPQVWSQLTVLDSQLHLGKEYLWRRWIAGQDTGDVNLKDVTPAADIQCIWEPPTFFKDIKKQRAHQRTCKTLRKIQLDVWHWHLQHRLEEKWAEELGEKLQSADRLRIELRSLNEGGWEAIMKGARVIGCTTTGAAMYASVIRSVKPSVLLVEEAGELQEAHVLTAMGPHTKHLVMIGDHKQLRPKIESYELSVESGKGYKLNVSMFERLVLSGFPHATLGVQHRMHPDISRLVRPSYPVLADHPSVESHPPVMGLGNHRVVFINHNKPELQEKGAGMWGQSGAHQSKVNMYEVGMVVATVRYLLQQGYRPDQVVVLTPYLGQLLEVQTALSDVMMVQLDERDLADLRKAAVPQAWAGLDANSTGVRVATIDNYQGEEADVVVASLVRSNTEGRVGFLKEPERINVLLSRARHGLILIGNGQTLKSATSSAARKHWSAVFQMLEASGSVMLGLPAACQQHNQPILPVLDTPAAFNERAPDGGCRQPCNAVMPCGHRCSLRCHAYDRAHQRVRCMQQVHSFCSAGHVTVVACADSSSTVCSTCVEITRIQETEREVLQTLESEAAHRRAELDVEKARVEAKKIELRQMLEASEEQTQRRKEVVLAEIEAKRLEQALAMQHARAGKELADWEAEQRFRVEQEMAEEAALEAERQAAERQAAAEQREQLQRTETELAASNAKLIDLETDAQKELQRIENVHRNVSDESVDAIVAAEGGAKKTLTAFKWREAAAKVGSEGIPGLQNFKQMLLDSAEQGSALADMLEVVFGAGMGERLVSYASGAQSASDQEVAAPTNIKRGLVLVEEAQWMDAMDFFKAQQNPAAATNSSGRFSDPTIGAFISLCSAKLGLSVKGSLFKTGAALVTVPLTGPMHPVQHLANAVSTTGSYQSGQERATAARSAGEALAFLLHPSTVDLPPSLVEEALAVLKAKSSSLSSTGPQMPSAASRSARQISSQRTAWENRAKNSEALTKLLGLTGMEPVKVELFNLADQVELEKERDRNLSLKQYNVVFHGNPGTGKTTVARIYAELLKELGVLPEAEVVETSGAALAHGGITELKNLLKQLKTGGVLFLDEAYQLNPKMNPSGAQVLDLLLPELENMRGKLVVVMAGYKKPMDQLMEFNEGLPSRFPLTFTFPDYSDAELLTIMDGIVAAGKPQPFKVQEVKHVRIAMSRLGRQRGTVGFGNARAVRNFYEQTINRQSARVLQEKKQGLQPDVWLFTRGDLLGPRHLDVTSSTALQELESLQGLHSVKESVSMLLALHHTNIELEDMEKPVKDVCLNRVFLGNPGTGKTTVAGIYGRILHELGLLSKGEVVIKNPSDFLGSVLGESEQKTVAILDATVGCVLVIDEAYGLHSQTSGWSTDPFKAAVIDTIVAKVQGVAGDDRCVLLLGYQEPIEKMFREANPGLARRFQLANAFKFEDYDKMALFQIMKATAKRKYGWDLGYPELYAGITVLEKERRRPNFGNAGAVNNLLSTAAQRMEQRLKHLAPAERAVAPLAPEDFLSADEAVPTDPSKVFSDLVGCKEVLAKLHQWQSTIRAAQKLGVDPLESFELNFLFTGAPGTGKTTVARRVGVLFHALGLLSTKEVVSCSASDFLTGYVGQSGKKTREWFTKAVGGVLFIDEGYRLNPKVGGDFMSEVVDEIVQLLTEPQFMKKMVVIIAGYESQVDELMTTVNPGLKSRFSEKLHFPDFSTEDSCSLLCTLLESKYSLQLCPEAEIALPLLMSQLISAPGWANGRDVGTWAVRIFRAYAVRTNPALAMDTPTVGANSGDRITQADLELSLHDVLASKGATATGRLLQDGLMLEHTFSLPDYGSSKGTTRTPSQPSPDALPFMFQQAQAQAPPPLVPAIAPQQVASVTAVPEVVSHALTEEPATDTEVQLQTDSPSFGGMSKDFLQGMQGSLEALGFDLTSPDAMQQLGVDGSLADQLMPLLASAVGSVTDMGMLREMVRQWQLAIQLQLEQEKKLARKGQRPVWRCSVCGRYGCPVAPYIESYQEVDLE